MVLKMLRSRRRRKMTRLRRRKLRRPRPSQSPLNQFVLMESSKILRYHRLKDPRYLEKLSLVKMLREEKWRHQHTGEISTIIMKYCHDSRCPVPLILLRILWTEELWSHSRNSWRLINPTTRF